jgi:hypothetical protein
MRSREGKSEIEKSEQQVQNWSFDEKFKVLATEGLVYDSTNDTLNRIVQPTTPTDIQLGEIIPVTRAILMAIANPSYVDKSANQVRSQVTGTISTVTNLTNMGSFKADHMQRMANMTAWSSNIRRLIT